jgi:glycosyltransferase involved in cell wall biosynthesis
MSEASQLVSVIVPTRNSARTLEACLVSVRSQLHQPIELVIVDNSSTDRTQEIAKRFGDVVETFGPERSAQRNRGVELSHGEYLLFIDSDMKLSPSVVGDCLRLLHFGPAPAVIVPEVSVGNGFLAACRALERSCYVGDDSVEAARFFARVTFDGAGGFDEGLTGGEDWDLTIRVATGRRLPRSASTILHDEGNLRLRTVLAKKRYYARSSIRYWRKHRGTAVRQANLVFRPAFIRHWRRLLSHPVLAAGVLSLKTLEAAAAFWGVIEGVARGRGAGVSGSA